ncbi:MAG: NusG domain II-containing protein [Nitrospirae bacterium]|nr:NusG domain II-containing protein [Nitrospirota bacterium]
MSLKEITKETTIADRFLVIALIILSISGSLFVKKAFPEGTDVRIDVDGKPVYLLPLDVNMVVAVKGMNGDSIVEIKDKKVRIKESSCPNKICVHNGWMDRGAIICLPNKVTVNIGSPENRQDRTIDAITG